MLDDYAIVKHKFQFARWYFSGMILAETC